MKIFCIGRNYVEHAAELNNPVPAKPIIFMKAPNALLTDGKDFYHPEFSNNIHYELELVLKICKNGKSVPPASASTYYDKIGLGIDFTARDLQDECKKKGHPWEIAKSFDSSAVLGSFIDTLGLDLNNIGFHLLKNGEVVQEGNSRDLIFHFDYLISYISTFFTLQQGDLIYTGTPAGVGKVERADVLEGYIGDKQLLYCRVK